MHLTTPKFRGIGTLAEGPLHDALKRHYAQEHDRLEVPLDGFVVDVFGPKGVVEIQTGGFSPLKRKLDRLLRRHCVRLVYPVCAELWIIKEDPETGMKSRRKSPKRRDLDEVFVKLVSLASYLDHGHFSLEVVNTAQEELRVFDPKRNRRRKGWTIAEKRLLEVRNSMVVAAPGDLFTLLDGHVPERFSTADLATALSKPRWFAQKVAYCLKHSGAALAVGKQGNAIIYERLPISKTLEGSG